MEGWTLFIIAALRITVPYWWAALGGFYSERSGIVNLALEGILLQGALATVLAAHAAETAGLPGGAAAWIGVLAGAGAGALTGALHALVCVRARGDQITSGIAINLLAAGLSKLVLTLVFGSASNSARIAGMAPWHIPFLADFAVTRTLVCTPLVLLAVLAAVATHLVVRRTRFGLRLYAVGELPRAVAAAGLSVPGLRWRAVVLSGALAGLGGSWLALDQHQFTAGMSSGRGFIALAALIFGKWTPRGTVLACLLFGGAEALQIQLQTRGTGVPTQFVQMLPYVVTLVTLAGVIGRARPPMALGRVEE